jgi:hypothetical protein
MFRKVFGFLAVATTTRHTFGGKALMEMNLQLHHVVSDITGATGMRSPRASERESATGQKHRDVS